MFERPLEVIICSEDDFPTANELPIRVGGHTNGCRIGFNAGGFDRKVSAVIDGRDRLLRGGRLAPGNQRRPAVSI